MLFALLLGITILAGLVAFLCKQYRVLALVAGVGSVLNTLLAAAVTLPILFWGVSLGAGAWNLDTAGALMVLLIGVIQLSATLVSIRYLGSELHEKEITFSQARWYYALVPLFTFSMLLTVAANNLGLMWVALEGTTIATVTLVAFYTKEGSLEAAWKYILICSASISLGLIGVLLVFYAAVSGGASGADAVTWSGLLRATETLPPSIMKLAFVFVFIGFGAKAGIVPLHTWLPDAHSRTPSPVSGMLSGLLLSVALFVLIRMRHVVDNALGSSAWTNHFFVVFGILTILLPVAFMLMQKNFKRLLAYSSVEHIGLMVFALGFGALGTAAALIHLVGHAFVKSSLFFSAGTFLTTYKSTKFEKVVGTVRRLPITSALFLLTLFILLGAPASPLFFSELQIVGAAFATHPFLVGVILLGMVVVVGAMVAQFMPMLFGSPTHTGDEPATERERWNGTHAVLIAHLAVLAAIGIALMTPVGQTWFLAIAESITL